MATCRLSTPAPGLRTVRSPVARTPGRVKRPSFLMSRWSSSSGRGTFVAQRRRLGQLERGEAVQAVAAQHARERGFGDGQHRHDLGVGAVLPAQSEDLGFERGRGLAWLTMRNRRAIGQARREASGLGASEPAAHGLLAHVISGGDGALREVLRGELRDHSGSHQRGERGISVHVVRAGWRAVDSSATTSLLDPCPADNVLKHDT